MIIAVDFDGTLCEHSFPEIGIISKRNEAIIEFVRYAKTKGHTIILWTCRTDTDDRKYLTEAVEWCKVNDIPIDYANENPEEEKKWIPYVSRKICADVYLDDRTFHADVEGIFQILNHMEEKKVQN